MEAPSICTVNGFLVPVSDDPSFVYVEVLWLSIVTHVALLQSIGGEFPDMRRVAIRLHALHFEFWNASESSV